MCSGQDGWVDGWMDGWTGGDELGKAAWQRAGCRVFDRARSVKQEASSSFRLAGGGWRGFGCSPHFMHHQPDCCPVRVYVSALYL